MEVESLEGSSQVDRLKILYPNVREELPRNFSNLDKCSSIGLALQNLRVHYKGVGKSHNDAASVRTAFPIPASCGLYYFEVKIISKGRDGYMGIGLTAHNFKMNRLPGWDKQSYGYHGDDGNSFCSSGNGQPYGPTFTTGDIIGCGVNLVDNTCFYTKNGHHLGIAFRDLPSRLYPTVGLQTPGEIVDANFGQKQFEFDIEDMLKELRASTKAAIYSYPLPEDQGDWTVIMHKMVSSYLVHHGFSATAEIFGKITGQTFTEDLSSIKNRQNISKLVLMGRMGQAIEQTARSYPGLLESNHNLMFMLKCRQFVEMVNGSDEADETESGFSSTMSRTIAQTSVIVMPLKQQQPNINILQIQSSEAQLSKNESHIGDNSNSNSSIEEGDQICGSYGDENCFSSIVNQQQRNNNKKINAYIENHYHDYNLDIEMENTNNGYKNGSSFMQNRDDIMEVDSSPASNKSVKSGIERMLEFGRELFQMSQQLEKENGVCEKNQKMLEDAFSLLAYSNPWSSPLGWQLCPSRRESICSSLNSAILESMDYSNRPPIEVCIAHAYDLLRLMSSSSLGSCAFVNIEDILQQN